MKKTAPIILSIFFCLPAMGQIFQEKLRMLEHENKGCPINSKCSKANGLKYLEWAKSLKVQDKEAQFKSLKGFFNKTGVPVHFLAKESVSEENDVILWNSRCRIHNPKSDLRKIYKAAFFSKTIPLDKDGFNFDKINVFEGKKIISYPASYGDRPVFIKNNKLFYLKDFEDFLYQASIDTKGKIKIENLPGSLYTKAQSKRVKETKCPENKEEHSDLYASSYCQKIWDIDSNSLKTIQVFWACP